MKLARLSKFAQKPIDAKIVGVRLFIRNKLAKLRFLPLRLWFAVSEEEEIRFGWSYFPNCFDAKRSVLDRECLGVDNGELRFLWKILRPGMTFLDIGAFHGIYSVVAAKRVGPLGRVIAFEPSRRERRVLKYHAWLNSSLNISIEPYAVTSSTGPLEFFVVGEGWETMNSLRPPAINGKDLHAKRIQVEGVSLDEYFSRESIAQLHCLKIDVEGGELDLLKGAGEVIDRHRPLIISEVLDWVSRPWGRSAKETVMYLNALSYSWFEFDENGNIQSHEPLDYYPDHVRNFLAVPNEKLSSVANLITSRNEMRNPVPKGSQTAA